MKKAGDKIGNVLRKRSTKTTPSTPKQRPLTVLAGRPLRLNQPKQNDALVRLNQLIANL